MCNVHLCPSTTTTTTVSGRGHVTSEHRTFAPPVPSRPPRVRPADVGPTELSPRRAQRGSRRSHRHQCPVVRRPLSPCAGMCTAMELCTSVCEVFIRVHKHINACTHNMAGGLRGRGGQGPRARLFKETNFRSVLQLSVWRISLWSVLKTQMSARFDAGSVM